MGSYYNTEFQVDEAVVSAAVNNTQARESLAVILLISTQRQAFPRLICMINLFRANVMATTRSIIYLFTRAETFSGEQRKILSNLDPEHIRLINIDDRSFRSPFLETVLAPPETWRHPHLPVEYRRVGHWRLTFQMAFVKRLGHRYVLAIDDDMFVTERVPYNIVKEFSSSNVSIAARELLPNGVHPEDSRYEVGLAEITRYFLLHTGIKPTLLYEHCHPPGLEGVFSRVPREGGPGFPNPLPALWNATYTSSIGFLGWDSNVIFANFYIVDVDFWYRKEVQRYVHLILGSGGHFSERWSEQGVITMLWLIFVPKEQFRLVNVSMVHKRTMDTEMVPYCTGPSGHWI